MKMTSEQSWLVGDWFRTTFESKPCPECMSRATNIIGSNLSMLDGGIPVVNFTCPMCGYIRLFNAAVIPGLMPSQENVIDASPATDNR
jgi:hypothetical protein